MLSTLPLLLTVVAVSCVNGAATFPQSSVDTGQADRAPQKAMTRREFQAAANTVHAGDDGDIDVKPYRKYTLMRRASAGAVESAESANLHTLSVTVSTLAQTGTTPSLSAAPSFVQIVKNAPSNAASPKIVKSAPSKFSAPKIVKSAPSKSASPIKSAPSKRASPTSNFASKPKSTAIKPEELCKENYGNGTLHPDGFTCCAGSCGDKCGAFDCETGEGGAFSCCSLDIPDHEICGERRTVTVADPNNNTYVDGVHVGTRSYQEDIMAPCTLQHPDPGEMHAPYCVRVITGSAPSNDGYLKIDKDAGSGFTNVVDSNHRHELSTTVMHRCEKDPIALEISGVSTDGWVGSVEFSDDFGEIWTHGDCVNCETPHTLCTTIMVDADAETGDNVATAICPVGSVCQVIESTTTTTTSTTTLKMDICSYVVGDADGDSWSSSTICDNTTASNTEPLKFVIDKRGCTEACSARALNLASDGLGCCHWQRMGAAGSGVYPCTWHAFSDTLSTFTNLTTLWESLTNASADHMDQVAMCINQ